MNNIVHLVLILSLLLLLLGVESERNAPNGVSKSPTRSLVRKLHQAKTKRLVVLPAKKEKLATKLMRGFTHVSERLRQTVKVTAESVSRLSRDATAYFSSDFEVLLLEMTAPTNSMTSPADIDRFITTTQSFIFNDDLVSQSNTFRVTLRKIWAKIAERHPLTVLKALHVLHSLLRATRPKDSKLYQRLILKMSREHSKKSRSKYFSKARPSAGALSTLLTVEDGPVQQFADRYYSYVIARGKQFTSSFAELEGVSFKTSGPDALKTVQAAGNLVDQALRCFVSAEQEGEVVAHCLELVAADLHALFSLYAKKAQFLLQENEVGDMFEGMDEAAVDTALRKLRYFYSTRYEQVESFMKEARELTESCALPDCLEVPQNFLGDGSGDEAEDSSDA